LKATPTTIGRGGAEADGEGGVTAAEGLTVQFLAGLLGFSLQLLRRFAATRIQADAAGRPRAVCAILLTGFSALLW